MHEKEKRKILPKTISNAFEYLRSSMSFFYLGNDWCWDKQALLLDSKIDWNEEPPPSSRSRANNLSAGLWSKHGNGPNETRENDQRKQLREKRSIFRSIPLDSSRKTSCWKSLQSARSTTDVQTKSILKENVHHFIFT